MSSLKAGKVLLSQNCNNLSLLVAFVSGVIINPYQSVEGRKLKGLKGLKLSLEKFAPWSQAEAKKNRLCIRLRSAFQSDCFYFWK